MSISGVVQTPVHTMSVFDQYYEQPSSESFCLSRLGTATNVSSHLCENVDYMIGSALVDPGCQEHLFQDIYEKYMLDTSSSNLCVSGFDGSTQPGRLQGWSHLYFLPRVGDSNQVGTGQYMRFEFDTVENNNENLLAVSSYYEDGADILFQHRGFCGIRGRDFDIPCHYSFENRGFEVEFVIAKSEDAAVKIGKCLEKNRRADNAVNASLARAMTLDDQQLAAAAALVRGNVSIRDNESYSMAELGQWGIDDDTDLKCEVCKVCALTTETADSVCWSFPAKAVSDAVCSDEECAMIAASLVYKSRRKASQGKQAKHF